MQDFLFIRSGDWSLLGCQRQILETRVDAPGWELGFAKADVLFSQWEIHYTCGIYRKTIGYLYFLGFRWANPKFSWADWCWLWVMVGWTLLNHLETLWKKSFNFFISWHLLFIIWQVQCHHWFRTCLNFPTKRRSVAPTGESWSLLRCRSFSRQRAFETDHGAAWRPGSKGELPGFVERWG